MKQFIFLVLVGISFFVNVTPQNDSLVLVHVLHRHGNRTPGDNGYANNPISNESFYEPFGFGALTTEGMKIAYKIGLSLRQKYNDFLGNQFKLKYLEARTTNYPRTTMSLQALLAALWRPLREDKFWPCLNWQPVPYTFLISDRELDAINACSATFVQEYTAVVKSPAIRNITAKYKPVLEYITNSTGQVFNSLIDVFSLHMELFSQEGFGYPLEEWTKKVYPEMTERICIEEYYIETNSTALKRAMAGYFLKKIITDTALKMNNTLELQERKMFLYSGHERTIAFVLITLGIFDDKIPPYGSHVMFEVHQIEGVYGFKIYYHDWTTTEPRLLTMPGCMDFCPYDDFINLVNEFLPVTEEC